MREISRGFSQIIVIVLLILVGAGAYFLGSQNIFQTFQGTPSPTATPNPTANWKTYTNTKLGFSFSYPPDLQIKEEVVDSTNIISLIGNNKPSGILVRVGKMNLQQAVADTKRAIEGHVVASLVEEKSVTVAGITGTKLRYEMGSEMETKNFNDYVILSLGGLSYTLQSVGNLPLFDQILSTFKFIENDVITPTNIPLVKIPIISTVGWKSINLNGIQFRIPNEYRFEVTNENIGLIYSPPSLIPSQVSVVPYKGGSRREQFLGKSPFDCHYIFEDALFGTVNALQIAADGGWCQGGAGAIVAVIGDKLVSFWNLYYDLETKEINRWDVRDTIVSTLKKD